MTPFNAIEQIQEIFPQLGEPYLLKELDASQKRFAGETKALTKTAQLSDISTNITWTLPTDCIAITDVLFYDSYDMPLYMDDLQLAFEIVLGKITFVRTDRSKITGLPSTIAYAYIEYINYPSTIDNISDSFELPEEIHEGIIADVLKKLHAKFPVEVFTPDGMVKTRDWKAVSFYKNEVREFEKKGRRLANNAKDKTSNVNIRLSKLGNPITLGRQRISTTSSVEIPGLSAFYSKYIRFTAVDGGDITINEQFGWINNIAVPTETGYTITVVSNSEFTTSMFNESTLMINSGYVDADTWTFELYPGYVTVVCEIKVY